MQACIRNQNPSINKKICIHFTYFMFYLVKVKKIFSYQHCKCDAANVDIVHIEVPGLGLYTVCSCRLTFCK